MKQLLTTLFYILFFPIALIVVGVSIIVDFSRSVMEAIKNELRWRCN